MGLPGPKFISQIRFRTKMAFLIIKIGGTSVKLDIDISLVNHYFLWTIFEQTGIGGCFAWEKWARIKDVA
jgi:hypothetical protein